MKALLVSFLFSFFIFLLNMYLVKEFGIYVSSLIISLTMLIIVYKGLKDESL